MKFEFYEKKLKFKWIFFKSVSQEKSTQGMKVRFIKWNEFKVARVKFILYF